VSAPDTATVEHRLARVMAIMTAMQCVTAAKGNCLGDAADACSYLALMADEEMAKARSALDVEVLNRDC
jgi:hypothetical protein